MNETISIARCDDYEPQAVRSALEKVLAETDGLSWLKKGMKVALKTNLVAGSDPEKAIVTHPAVLTALTEILVERRAEVVIGDSPGGTFSAPVLKHIYKASGLEFCEAAGASLNNNFEQTETSFPEGVIMKHFTYTSWVKEADAVIGVCKLKSHGMMTMSANVKNFFGIIPGTMKLEYHYRFPNHDDFADMLVDINEYLKPALYITDAIVGMEGNGPTAGTPRKIGALLASKDPYALDVLCAELIGLTPEKVPTIRASVRRGLTSADTDTLQICGEWKDLIVSDYEKVEQAHSITFSNYIPGFLQGTVARLMQARPQVTASECIGCKKCFEICPAKAITMKDGKPQIDRSKCIRCFCCQEFCPKGAMKVHRRLFTRVINKF